MNKIKKAKLMAQIRQGYKSQSLCFRKLPFQRVVREITKKEMKRRRKMKEMINFDKKMPANFDEIMAESSDIESQEDKVRFTKQSLSLLQRSTENMLLSLFEDAYMCTLHAKRVTLYNKDLRLAKILTKNYDEI